jgi:hypothetical protein
LLIGNVRQRPQGREFPIIIRTATRPGMPAAAMRETTVSTDKPDIDKLAHKRNNL